MQYRVLGGLHRLPDGTIVKKGEIFESPDTRLVEKFRNKFERVVPAPAPINTQNVATPEAEKTPVQKAAEAGAAEILPNGQQDMTAEFPKAQEANLVVTKDRRGWYVYDADDRDGAINEKPLKKKDVPGFLEEYLA